MRRVPADGPRAVARAMVPTACNYKRYLQVVYCLSLVLVLSFSLSLSLSLSLSVSLCHSNLVVRVVPQVIPAVAGLEQQLRLDVPGEHNVRPVPTNAGSQLLSDGCLGIAAG